MRFSKADWIAVGMQLLRAHGPAALSIDRLTAAAEKTRGSFYHHFADRDCFLGDFMATWRREVLENRSAALLPDNDPERLRAALRTEPFAYDHALERQLRQLAATEPVVRQVVDEVDRARIAGLAKLIATLRPAIVDPEATAFLQYAVLVGSQWLIADLADPRLPSALRAAYEMFEL